MDASKDSLLSHGARGGDSRASLSGCALPVVRITLNAPAPDEWTLVREMNMEKREPCEVYLAC